MPACSFDCPCLCLPVLSLCPPVRPSVPTCPSVRPTRLCLAAHLPLRLCLVCLSAHLSVCPFVHQSACGSFYLHARLFDFPCLCLPILSVCLPARPSVRRSVPTCPSDCLYVCLPTCRSVSLSCLSVRPSVSARPSARLCPPAVCLSLCLSLCLRRFSCLSE